MLKILKGKSILFLLSQKLGICHYLVKFTQPGLKSFVLSSSLKFEDRSQIPTGQDQFPVGK